MGGHEGVLGDALNELERVEAQAIREAVVLGGGRGELVGGASCVAHPIPIPELNRAQPVGAHVDVGAVSAWFGTHPHIVNVAPEHAHLEDELSRRGYTRGYAWMKFERDATPPAPAETDLRVEETLAADAFGLVTAEGFGIPPEVNSAMTAIVGAPGWSVFVAYEGDEPAGCGALYCDGAVGWLGIGATRPQFRRRGAQNAILAARIVRAGELGASRVTTETGVLDESRPNGSYRNILRAGFREAYVRDNWLSPR